MNGSHSMRRSGSRRLSLRCVIYCDGQNKSKCENSVAETNHIPDKLADFFRNPAYERRLVIFYDVLGWRNHINAADGDIEKIGDLRRLILQSHRSLRLRH